MFVHDFLLAFIEHRFIVDDSVVTHTDHSSFVYELNLEDLRLQLMNFIFRILILTLLLAKASIVSASNELGVDWFSLVELESKSKILHVQHIFLGAGDRKAFFELEGCAEGNQMFQNKHGEDEEYNFFSTFEVEECSRVDDMKLHLYFEEANGQLRQIRTYAESRGYNDPSDLETSLALCVDSNILVFSGRIPSDRKEEIFEVSMINDSVQSKVLKFSVIAGHAFELDYDMSESSCDGVTELIIDDIRTTVEHVSNQ